MRMSACVRSVGLALMAAAWTAVSAPVRAAPLADPTRPANEWLAAQPGADGAPAGDALPGVRVVVAGRARKLAIIDGQLVRLGETYNGARLVGVGPDGVVLQKDGSKEKLSMSPAVEKKTRLAQPAAGGGKPGHHAARGEGQ